MARLGDAGDSNRPGCCYHSRDVQLSVNETKKPKAVLISTYELGRQPFGLASAAAWLERAGAAVTCLDLSCQALDEAAIGSADFVAFYVPMHTATRLALKILPTV